MQYRSGKIQYLFWSFFFSIMIYIWIIAVVLQTFVLPEKAPMQLPTNVISLLFILYGFLIVLTLSGLIISIMIGNTKYSKRFSAMVFIIFGSIIIGKGIFG